MEANLIFPFVFVGEHLTNEFESLNPFKKVPFIDDKGTVLIER